MKLDEGQESTSEEINPAGLLEKKRTKSHRRVTLGIRRIRQILQKGQGEDNRRRSLSGKETSTGAIKNSGSTGNPDQGSSDSGSNKNTTWPSDKSESSNNQGQASHSQGSPANQMQNRLSDYLIEKWKGTVADIREKGHVPASLYMSNLVRKCVRAEFDPDFRDMREGRIRPRFQGYAERDKK